MSNVQLADKDDWLCLLSFPQPIPALSNPSHEKKARKPHSHARSVNDCLIVSLIRLLAKLSVITAWKQDITGEEMHIRLLEGKGLIAPVVCPSFARKNKN